MPRLPTKREKSRLSLEVSTQVRERLERLRGLSDADSLTEVIRRAAAVYELLLEHQDQGCETIIRRLDDGTEKAVLLP